MNVVRDQLVKADLERLGWRVITVWECELVAIYDDRLEIQNPGPFPFGLTITELKAGVSKIRNRMIARIMRMLHMMEEWGSGYPKDWIDKRLRGIAKWPPFISSIEYVF